MKNLKNSIPNFVTTLNLISGLAGLVFLFQGNFGAALIMVVFAAFFDFTDGMLAHLLNAKSEFGKQLDSLSDAISFGMVPGFMAYLFLKLYIIFHPEWPVWICYIGFTLTIFAIFRLARFNSDNSNKTTFTGLAVPAMALFISSLIWYILKHQNPVSIWFEQLPIFISIIVLLNVLMISRISMFSLKFRNFSWGSNKIRWIFIIISGILLLIFRLFALPLIITIYVGISVVLFLLKKEL
jgi:CDP-diacylglycerol--serine O-phosphatidyltransferase